MAQPLFIQAELQFEKVAGEVPMPEDPNAWPQEILQELYKQAPYIADFEPDVTMERVDAEQGTGFGSIQIGNRTEAPAGASSEQMQAAGIRSVRIPVIVQEGNLQPFDVIVTEDSKMLPLTEERLRQALFRPQAFDVTARTPGDVSMVGQLYPPYRQNYGFGGSGVTVNADAGKTASMKKEAMTLDEYLASEVKHGRMGKKAEVSDKPGAVSDFVEKNASAKPYGSLLEAILPTINQSDYESFCNSVYGDRTVQAAFQKNAEACYKALKTLSEYTPYDLKKTAAVLPSLIKPTVLQLSKVEDGYQLKVATHKFWQPVTENLDRGQAVRRCGEKVVLAADMAGSATVQEGGGVAEEDFAEQPSLVSEPGQYMVCTTNGDKIEGVVIPNLLDTDGQPKPISLFTNGAQSALQSDIVGVRTGETTELPVSEPQGYGIFYCDAEGPIVATIPLNLHSRVAMPNDDGYWSAETFDGRLVEVRVSPFAQKIMAVDSTLAIPAHYKWMSLDNSEEVDLMKSHDEYAANKTAQARHIASVEVLCGGEDSFTVRGFAVEKLAYSEREFLAQDEALFLLAGLGANLDYAQKKMASAYVTRRPATVRIGNLLKTAEETKEEISERVNQSLALFPSIKRPLWKEAAVITDPVAVDTVLSLGFVNPENVSVFISYLPQLEEAQGKLCELLVASRLGLREIPSPPLEKAIRALEDVLSGIKTIAFQS